MYVNLPHKSSSSPRRAHAGQGNEDNQAEAGIDTDAGWQAEVQVEEEPLARLYITLLQRFGVETDSFGGLLRVRQPRTADAAFGRLYATGHDDKDLRLLRTNQSGGNFNARIADIGRYR